MLLNNCCSKPDVEVKNSCYGTMFSCKNCKASAVWASTYIENGTIYLGNGTIAAELLK